jgi:hypothetical protein
LPVVTGSSPEPRIGTPKLDTPFGNAVSAIA